MKYWNIEKRNLNYIVENIHKEQYFKEKTREELMDILRRRYNEKYKYPENPMKFIYENNNYSLWRCFVPGKEGYRVYSKWSKRTRRYYVLGLQKCIDIPYRKEIFFQDL